jgi:hypothetical protein
VSDLRSGVIRTSTDLHEVKKLVGRLMGVACWGHYFSYGDELVIELGAKRVCPVGPLAGDTYGAWQVFTRGSDWSLREGEDALADNLTTRPEAETALSKIVSAIVKRVSMGFPQLGLSIIFDNGTELLVDCDGADDEPRTSNGADDSIEAEEVACWELYTPDGYFVEVRSGGRWAMVADDRSRAT